MVVCTIGEYGHVYILKHSHSISHTAGQIKLWAKRIHERTVVTKTMPLANLTQITEDELETLDHWWKSGAELD